MSENPLASAYRQELAQRRAHILFGVPQECDLRAARRAVARRAGATEDEVLAAVMEAQRA